MYRMSIQIKITKSTINMCNFTNPIYLVIEYNTVSMIGDHLFLIRAFQPFLLFFVDYNYDLRRINSIKFILLKEIEKIRDSLGFRYGK